MKSNANGRLIGKIACKTQRRKAFAFTFVLLAALVGHAASQVIYQGTIAGSDGSSGVVVYTLPNAPTTQTTIGLRNTGTKKTSSGTLAITPALVTAPASPVSPPPIVPVTEPSAPVTGMNGAAIRMTNPTGPIYPLDGVFVNCHGSSFSDAQLLTSNILWDFGDAGRALNMMKGWNAAHSYAAPGTYTITLTITLANGNISTATMPVTISQDNRPVVDKPGAASLSGLLSSTVYTIHGGGTYGPLNLSGLMHVLVKVVGSGTATIDGGNSNCVLTSASTAACAVAGNIMLTCDANGAVDGCDPVGNGLTFIGGTITACENGFNLNQNPTNVLIQGWTVPDGSAKATKTTMDGYFAWVQGQEINVIGNTVANTLSQAIIRADANGAEDVDISYNNLTKTTPASDSYKNCLTLMWSNYTTAYMNRCTNGPVQTGPLGDVPGSGASNSASWTNGIIDSNVLLNSKIIICPETIGLVVSNNVIHSPNTNAIWINAQTSFGSSIWQVQNVTLENNTVQSGDDYSGFLYLEQGEAKNVSVVNNVYDDPSAGLGQAGNAYIYDTNGDLNSFTAIAGNVWGAASNSSSSAFCVGNGQTSSSAWKSVSQFEAIGLSGGGNATGDVIENITFGSTYAVGAAGSNLPVAGN